MSASIPSTGSNKQRFSQLDLYTDGDPDFKGVLIELMIDNLLELQQSLYEANEQHDHEVFRKACHKVKTTLSMLDSKELSNIVEELINRIEGQDRIAIFHKLSGDIIKSLREEKNNIG